MAEQLDMFAGLGEEDDDAPLIPRAELLDRLQGVLAGAGRLPEPPAPRPAQAVVARTCECMRARGAGDAFTNTGTATDQWWVHVACGLPTFGWLATARQTPHAKGTPA